MQSGEIFRGKKVEMRVQRQQEGLSLEEVCYKGKFYTERKLQTLAEFDFKQNSHNAGAKIIICS